MSQQQRIARNTLLAIVGVAGAGFVRLAFTIATGRAFGSAVLGDIAVIVAVATIATIPAAGIGAAGNRFLAVASGADDKTTRYNILGATWRGAVLAIGAAVATSWLYLMVQSAASFDTVSLVLGLAFVAGYGLYLTGKGVLFGDGQADRYAIGEVIGVIAFVISLVVVLSTSMSSGWILATQVSWVLGVVVVATVSRVGPTTFAGRAPSGLWSFATTATVGSLVSLGVAQATVLAIAALHGTSQAGLLAAGLAVTAPLYLLPRGLSLALTPAMSYHVGAGARARANLDARYSTTVLVLFGGVVASSIIAFTELILAVYGKGFAEATTFVAVFAIASFVAVTGIPVVNRFASEGAPALRLTVIASAIGAVAAVVIWFTLGRNDPEWIAIGFLVASIVKVTIPFALSRRVTGRFIVPGIGVTLLTSAGVAAAFLPTPWQFFGLISLILAAVPLLFVATVRYRARAATLSASGRPLTVGVLTNVYPLSEYPYYGVFVQDRVAAYEALDAQVVVTSPRHKTGVVKYLRLTIDSLTALATHPIPDVYEVHPTQPTGVIAMVVAWIAERPYVLYAHGADVTIRPRSRIYRNLVHRAIQRAAEIHTNSTHMAEMIRSEWEDAPNILVVPPGVRIPDAIVGYGERDIDVLFVGNMISRKGVDVLIDAISLIPDAKDVAVVIAGDGPDLDQLQHRAVAAGLDIAFPGTVVPASVAGLMARAKVVAVPSRYEPLGQVAVEALAQGTPIVVSDTGGLRSTPTPGCGSVVPPEEPQALADALATWISLTDQESADVARRARARATEFAIDQVAAQALERFAIVAHWSAQTVPNTKSSLPLG